VGIPNARLLGFNVARLCQLNHICSPLAWKAGGYLPLSTTRHNDWSELHPRTIRQQQLHMTSRISCPRGRPITPYQRRASISCHIRIFFFWHYCLQNSKMAISMYVACFLGAVVSWIAAPLFYEWYRLSHIPGPFWASFSKYWMVSQSLKGQMHSALKEVTDKYGWFPD
jgi:hypothetical protein